MSVTCNIVLKNGAAMKIRYACFGFLRVPMVIRSCSDFYHCVFKFSLLKDGESKTVLQEEFENAVGDVSPSDIDCIEYIPLQEDCYRNIWGQANAEYFKACKALLKEVPMFQDCVTILPRKKLIRVKIGNNPADKVILCLMLFRNLYLAREYGAYDLARKQKCRHFLSMILEGSFYKSQTGGYGSTLLVHNICPAISDENSFVDFRTMGRKSLLDLIKQGEDYNPWYQDQFKDTEKGYLRDSDFRDLNDVFNEDDPCANDDYDEWDEEDEDDDGFSEDSQCTRFRALTSCFSQHYLTGDTPIPGVQELAIYSDFRVMLGANHRFTIPEFNSVINALKLELSKGGVMA